MNTNKLGILIDKFSNLRRFIDGYSDEIRGSISSRLLSGSLMSFEGLDSMRETRILNSKLTLLRDEIMSLGLSMFDPVNGDFVSINKELSNDTKN